MPSSDVTEEQEQVVEQLSSMNGISIVDDLGVTRETDFVLPSGFPESDEMWVRELKVSLNSSGWNDILSNLDLNSKDSLHTVVKEKDLKQGESVTIQVCTTEFDTQ
jgi:hypothetical protein